MLGLETAGWGGGLPRERVVVAKRFPSLESLSSLGFKGRNLGCPGNFAGMFQTPGGFQNAGANKSFCSFFGTTIGPKIITVHPVIFQN